MQLYASVIFGETSGAILQLSCGRFGPSTRDWCVATTSLLISFGLIHFEMRARLLIKPNNAAVYSAGCFRSSVFL